MVGAHAFNPNIQEAEAGESRVPGQPLLLEKTKKSACLLSYEIKGMYHLVQLFSAFYVNVIELKFLLTFLLKAELKVGSQKTV